jgi:16S rRNA processing protein RimM
MRLEGEAGDWLAPGAELVLAEEGARAGRGYVVATLAPGRREEWRVTLEGVEDRDASEALRGRAVFVAADALAPLPDGEFYAYQVVGCRLEDEHGRPVGTVKGIWETGSDVLLVEGADGAEHLVPAALLREVDPEAGRAVAEIPPGLLETDGP